MRTAPIRMVAANIVHNSDRSKERPVLEYLQNKICTNQLKSASKINVLKIEAEQWSNLPLYRRDFLNRQHTYLPDLDQSVYHIHNTIYKHFEHKFIGFYI